MATRIRSTKRRVGHGDVVLNNGAPPHSWHFVQTHYSGLDDKGDLECLWACPCGSFLKTRVKRWVQVRVPDGVTWDGDDAEWTEHETKGGSVWHEASVTCPQCEAKP